MKTMRHTFNLALLILVVALQGTALQSAPIKKQTSARSFDFIGRWQVKFTMSGLEKNLILVSQEKGVASFLLQDTAPDDKPVAEPQRATWSQLTNDRVSVSGEAELPIGTCCREIGTLIFKGKFTSNNSVAGKLIFVTSVDEDESPYKLRSVVGTFSATRLLK